MVQFKTALVHEAMMAVTQSLFLTIWLSIMIFFEINQNGILHFLGLLTLVVGIISLSIILDKGYNYYRLSSDDLKTLGLADLTVLGLTKLISLLVCLWSPSLCEKHLAKDINHQRMSPVYFPLIILSYTFLISLYRAISCFVHYVFKSVFGIGLEETRE